MHKSIIISRSFVQLNEFFCTLNTYIQIECNLQRNGKKKGSLFILLYEFNGLACSLYRKLKAIFPHQKLRKPLSVNILLWLSTFVRYQLKNKIEYVNDNGAFEKIMKTTWICRIYKIL